MFIKFIFINYIYKAVIFNSYRFLKKLPVTKGSETLNLNNKLSKERIDLEDKKVIPQFPKLSLLLLFDELRSLSFCNNRI